MLGRVLAESVPPGSFVSRDGVVALEVVVVLSREGKPHPVLFTRVRKTGRSRTLGPATTKAPLVSLC